MSIRWTDLDSALEPADKLPPAPADTGLAFRGRQLLAQDPAFEIAVGIDKTPGTAASIISPTTGRALAPTLPLGAGADALRPVALVTWWSEL